MLFTPYLVFSLESWENFLAQIIILNLKAELRCKFFWNALDPTLEIFLEMKKFSFPIKMQVWDLIGAFIPYLYLLNHIFRHFLKTPTNPKEKNLCSPKLKKTKKGSWKAYFQSMNMMIFLSFQYRTPQHQISADKKNWYEKVELSSRVQLILCPKSHWRK